MQINTYFTPFVKNGKVECENVGAEWVPVDRYWKFSLCEMTDHQRQLAHIGMDQDMVDLYAPGASETTGCLVYTGDADLDRQLVEMAQYNTNLRGY